MDRQVDLSTVGMPITGAEEATERARVRSGTLTDLGRLMLWSPSKAPGESSHFSVTTVRGLSSLPPGVEAGQKLTVEERTKVRLLTYTGGGVKQWRSAIFARCEKGVTQSEAEDALGRVEGWYEYYVARDFTPAEAFHKVVLRWPDAFFDCYSFPKRGERYQLRKIKDNAGNSRALEAITASSAQDTMTDTDDAEYELAQQDTGTAGDQAAGRTVPEQGVAGADHTTLPQVDVPEDVASLMSVFTPMAQQVLRQNSAMSEAFIQQLKDMQKSLAGSVTAGGDLDVNNNKNEIPAKKKPTTRSRSRGGGGGGGSPAAGGSGGGHAEGGRGRGRSRGKGGAAAGAGGGGEEPPRRGGKKKNPDDKEDDASPTKRRKEDKGKDKKKEGEETASTSRQKTLQETVEEASRKAKDKTIVELMSEDRLSQLLNRMKDADPPPGAPGSVPPPGTGAPAVTPPPSVAGPSTEQPPAPTPPPKKTPTPPPKKTPTPPPKKTPTPPQPQKTPTPPSAASKSKERGRSKSKPPSSPVVASKKGKARKARVPSTSSSSSSGSTASSGTKKTGGRRTPTSSESESSAPSSAGKLMRKGPKEKVKKSGKKLAPALPVSKRIPGSGKRGARQTSKPKAGTKAQAMTAPGAATATATPSQPGPSGTQAAADSSAANMPQTVHDELMGNTSDEDDDKSEQPVEESSQDSEDDEGRKKKLKSMKLGSLNRAKLRKIAPRDDHKLLMFYMEKIHKAQSDQFLKVKRRQRLIYKEQMKLADRLTALEKSLGGVAKDAKRAATDKEVQEYQESNRSKLRLKWTTMQVVEEVVNGPDTAPLLIRYLAEDVVCEKAKDFPRKAFTALFDGHLIGYVFPWHPKGYSEQEPIMNNCEECFVMPEELLQMMVDRMLALGEDRKEAKKKIKTYLEGRRTTQGHMAMATIYRREWKDDVCYWCSVHEEGQLKIIWGTAPFRGTDSDERKAAWLGKYRERIKLNYEDKRGRRVPTRRDEAESEAAARKEEKMIRTMNHPGPFN